MYVRNTAAQLKVCMSGMGNPFKKYNVDMGTNYDVLSAGDFSYLVKHIGEKESEMMGYACALSTFHNLRGVDMSDVDCIWLEEFIQDAPLKYDQFVAFCRMYETINRNRELLGQKPVQVIFTANSQILNNDILAGFGLIPIIEKMDRKGQEYYQKGDILICRHGMAELMAEKAQTMLYRNIKGTSVFDEAIENEFANDSFYNVQNRPIKEYKIWCQIDNIYIYEHKTDGSYYCCRTRGECVSFTTKDTYTLFLRHYGVHLREAYGKGLIYFSEYQLKAQMLLILKV